MTDAIAAKYAHLADPGIRRFMMEAERLYPDNAVTFTTAELRAFYGAYSARFRAPQPADVSSHDFSVGSVPCRRYTPENQTGAQLLYLHGGGLLMGDLDTHDDICAELAAGTGAVTVAVAYRLAPEHPYPAALEDCWSVLCAVTAGGQPVIVSGNSSGAMLAAYLCFMARDAGNTVIKGQVLIAPSLGGDTGKGSYVAQAKAPGLSTADVVAFRRLHASAKGKYAAPLQEGDFHGLPPAFLVAAGLDPLHDDCFNYAAKLKAAGVAAEVRDEPLLVHDAIRARHMSEPAAESFKAIAAAVRRFASTK